MLNILRQLCDRLPASVQFHLFGVKSTALAEVIRAFPERIASADSAAWDMAERELQELVAAGELDDYTPRDAQVWAALPDEDGHAEWPRAA